MLAVLTGEGCQRKEEGNSGQQPGGLLVSWPRRFFQPTGATALVWYQVYGHFPDTVEISRGKYRCAGVPAGIELQHYWRREHEDIVTGFLKQPFLGAALKREMPELASAVESASECTVIRGEIPDSMNLDYLRDAVGLVTWFLDNGGLAVLDPQTFRWYGREKWRRELFEPNDSVPRQHVVIFLSGENGGDTNAFWCHTRGLRKFARPDLSVHNVPAQNRDAVIDLLNRLVEAQAFGGVIAEGQAIKMQSLPEGMTCHHDGRLDDPDFNNTHIEIGWPK
jgi:hypothetical protein